MISYRTHIHTYKGLPTTQKIVECVIVVRQHSFHMYCYRHFQCNLIIYRLCQWCRFRYPNLNSFRTSKHTLQSARIILCTHLTNERLQYIVTSSLIGLASTQNDPRERRQRVRSFTVSIELSIQLYKHGLQCIVSPAYIVDSALYKYNALSKAVVCDHPYRL